MNVNRECVLWSIPTLCSYFRVETHTHQWKVCFHLPFPISWSSAWKAGGHEGIGLHQVFMFYFELPASHEPLIYGQSVKYLNWDLCTWPNPSERNQVLQTGQGLRHASERKHVVIKARNLLTILSMCKKRKTWIIDFSVHSALASLYILGTV